jgi:cell division septal protein FtsQ
MLEDKILGKNILLLDLKKIAGTIELGPGAQSVRVVREMPATIRIEIQKRKPIANVQLRPGGPYAIVAEDGYIIENRPAINPAWILIEDFGEPFKEPRIGARLQNKGFPEALRFMKIFRKHELARRETLTRISLDPYGNVTIRLGEGPDFQLGRRASERLSFLIQAVYLFKTEPRENIEYMDLQYDRVAVKRKV